MVVAEVHDGLHLEARPLFGSQSRPQLLGVGHHPAIVGHLLEEFLPGRQLVAPRRWVAQRRFQSADRDQRARRHLSRPQALHEARFVLQHLAVVPPDRGRNRHEVLEGRGATEQRMQRGQPAEGVPHERLVGWVDPHDPLDERLHLLVEHAQVVVHPAKAVRRRRHPFEPGVASHRLAQWGGQIVHAKRQRLGHPVSGVADAHDHRIAHVGPAGLDAHGVHRDAEVKIAVDQIDHRVPAGRCRAGGQRDQQSVVAVANRRPEIDLHRVEGHLS